MSLAADENAVNPNEGATKVKDRNIGSVLSRRRKYLQEQKNANDDGEDDGGSAPPITLAKDNSLLKKGWQEDEDATSTKEQKGGRKLLGIFGKNSTANVEKQTQQDNSYLFQNVPRPLDVEDEEGAFIPSLDQVGGNGMEGSVAEAPEEYASQKVQTLQELDQSTKATLHHFLNMKYDDRGLDLSLLTGVLSYPLDELEQDDDWGNPQFVRDLLNSIKTTKKPLTVATPTTPLAKIDRQVKTREL
ncbi:predicted protein [Naegleria gruberi]|uniref:Predicted protein n=1 Tax=Naegleria gruberi TaxID=5762 RepID=D2V0Q3_NAEGR|nr:uncharacterized protein NAEGRDRAFT_62376 [Naegleria gruberi]EFC49766.1 predicted protein [Naegleria gruberi]|eukprot:XP_002682510.1 predicted protein [Naegleria gruberi strain NEG-M]